MSGVYHKSRTGGVNNQIRLWRDNSKNPSRAHYNTRHTQDPLPVTSPPVHKKRPALDVFFSKSNAELRKLWCKGNPLGGIPYLFSTSLRKHWPPHGHTHRGLCSMWLEQTHHLRRVLGGARPFTHTLGKASIEHVRAAAAAAASSSTPELSPGCVRHSRSTWMQRTTGCTTSYSSSAREGEAKLDNGLCFRSK